MNIAMLSTAVGLVVTLGGGGYVFAEKLNAKADKQDLIVAGARVDFIYDKMLESNYEQIVILDKQTNKSQDERDRLKYLRKERERIQQLKEKQ